MGIHAPWFPLISLPPSLFMFLSVFDGLLFVFGDFFYLGWNLSGYSHMFCILLLHYWFFPNCTIQSLDRMLQCFKARWILVLFLSGLSKRLNTWLVKNSKTKLQLVALRSAACKPQLWRWELPMAKQSISMGMIGMWFRGSYYDLKWFILARTPIRIWSWYDS